MVAALEDSENIIKKLLNYPNIDMNRRDEVGHTFIYHTFKIRLILIIWIQLGRTSLLLACKNDCNNAVKLLLKDARVDVNLQDDVRLLLAYRAAIYLF